MNLQSFSNRQARDAQGGSAEEEARDYRLQGDSIGVDESQFLRQCYWATRLLISLSWRVLAGAMTLCRSNKNARSIIESADVFMLSSSWAHNVCIECEPSDSVLSK
jgi:hypothetical protein